MSAEDLRSRIVQCSAKPVPQEQADLGTIYIRRLTLGELDAMQKEAQPSTDPKAPPPPPMTVRLLSRFLGDEHGKPIFDLAVKADVEALLAFPVGIAADVLRAGNSVNKLEETTPAKNA